MLRPCRFAILLILTCAAVGEARPKLFAELEASPTGPTEAAAFRFGMRSEQTRLFVGYFFYRNVDKDEVDSPGWKFDSEHKFLAGIQWFTTSSPTAVIVPSLGGGITAGKYGSSFYSWHYNSSLGGWVLEDRPVKSSAAIGVFADTGLKFRIIAPNVLLSTTLHWNMTTADRSSTESDYYNYKPVDQTFAMLNMYLLVGASYEF